MAEAKYCESTRDAAEEPPAYTPSSGQPLQPSCQDVEQGVQLSPHEPPAYTPSYGKPLLPSCQDVEQGIQLSVNEPPAYTPSSGQPPLPSCQDVEQGVQLSVNEPPAYTPSYGQPPLPSYQDVEQGVQLSTHEPPAYTPSSGQPPLPSCQDVEQGVQLSTHEPTVTTLSGLEVETPPPSYESLHGQAKAMKAESSETVDFIKDVAMLFIYIILLLVFLGILLGLPVYVIVLGAKHKDDCPAEHYIPIFLIVVGSFAMLRNSITIMQGCCQKEDKKEENTRKVNPIDLFFDCCLFALCIAGSVLIFRIKGEFSTTPGDSNFCQPALYWSVVAFIGVVCFGLGCRCFCGLFAMCRGSDSKQAQAWSTP